MRFPTVAPILIAALIVPRPAVAQWTERVPAGRARVVARQELAPGARVRALVSSEGAAAGWPRRVGGRLVRLDADSLLIDRGDRVVALPRREVTRLELPDGSVPRGRAALRGAGIGGSIGFVTGAALSYLSYDPCEAGTILCFSRSDETMLGGIAGGAVGLVAGAAVGAARAGERWRAVPLGDEARVAVVASPSRVGLAVRF